MWNEQSRTPARGWVKKALCAGVIMGLSMTAGMSYAAQNDKGGYTGMTPYARIAKVAVVRKANGQIDREATYNKAKTVALDIARHVAHVDDGPSGTGYPSNWIVGGLENGETADDATINSAIIRIPSPDLIDKKNPALGIKKANVMDLCNSYYAKRALGVDPITGGDTEDKTDDMYVVNGYSHTPALPCELATWNDDEHIYVDMLDPNAIFTLFFTDVFVSDEMQDEAFAAAIRELPSAVKGQIKAIVYDALDSNGYNYAETDQAMGPKYRDIDAAYEVVASSPHKSPFKHVAYTKTNKETFTLAETRAVTEEIMYYMTIHGTPGAEFPAAGFQLPDLADKLSDKSMWRSARHEPLGLPGIAEGNKKSKNWVIEACSPTYAKMAMSTGMHHVTALPCEITVQRVNVDESEDGSAEALVISYLDPNFMLDALFADMSDKEKEALGDVPGYILNDLQTIVQYALDNGDIDELNEGKQISYTMLPEQEAVQ
jgi:uncharacterized protein (DUF302 family)